ncbi:armadillo-type protein [Mycena pura]|uniref:Armadillo-type protein n=1 Tax=Mycena pura TaxID=153505 RepID=A0AAD6VKJ2_9AGAR|nr:armadillo-type protein [Mycena pura]
MAPDDSSQRVFQRLKPVCVSLLGVSRLTPSSIPKVSKLLKELLELLHDIKASGNNLNSSLLSYTFFPLSTILSRNKTSEIPDQILEKIFLVLKILCEDWWWICDTKLWEQVFILCGSIIGDIEGKGIGKIRDEETKDAASQCLFSILRARTEEEEVHHSESAATRLSTFQAYASSQQFTPILGQTLDSLLTTVESRNHSLQLVSLDLLYLLISTYFPDGLTPSVLPGLVSTMTKLALGVPGTLGWARGATVAGSLKVMQAAVVQSIGDDVCIRDGAIRCFEDLEDLVDLLDPEPGITLQNARPFFTARTPSWLRGTSSQLHIALNTLTPLVSHTTPSALLALVDFSSNIAAATALTLPQSQPLLLSFLLSLSISTLPVVSAQSRSSLLKLLTSQTNARQTLLQTLMYTTRDNLSALPRLLSSQADSKVEHVAGIIEAVCALAAPGESDTGIVSISKGLGVLLGPTGGIEKWGWRLLSVLELDEPLRFESRMSAAQLMLETDGGADEVVFPELTFKNVSTRSAYEALIRMFHGLGRAAGDNCLAAVEWFTNVGHNGTSSQAVAAIWCACRLLEGVSDMSILSGNSGDLLTHKRSRRLEKLARGLAKSVAELWDYADDTEIQVEKHDEDAPLPVLHLKGLDNLQNTLNIVRPSPFSTQPKQNSTQPILHRILCLQVLAVISGILQARSAPLLIYILYPVLHSLVSPVHHLSSTALATLNFITRSASYASSANLLLSNFDYALDSVARRLTRRWLDVVATKVLAVLVRLVGAEVVDRAGDVVEQCFDRLDEFHGYDVIVEGLVEVLREVIKVIEVEEVVRRGDESARPASPLSVFPRDSEQLQTFFDWFPRRHETFTVEEHEPSVPEDPSEQSEPTQEPPIDQEPPSTPTLNLTKQIVSRSLFFLTHGSPVVRARILSLLAASVHVLPETALLPSIHSAWPFILNRLSDPETFVVADTASLIEALVTHVGSFMFRRMWNDVWPRYSTMLAKLDAADATSALSRRGRGAVGYESAYTHSHRLHRSLLKSMTATMKGVRTQDTSVWEALLLFRRFLHRHAHEELQRCGREFYIAASAKNADAVWLALTMTLPSSTHQTMAFLQESKWDIEANVDEIFRCTMT